MHTKEAEFNMLNQDDIHKFIDFEEKNFNEGHKMNKYLNFEVTTGIHVNNFILNVLETDGKPVHGKDK